MAAKRCVFFQDHRADAVYPWWKPRLTVLWREGSSTFLDIGWFLCNMFLPLQTVGPV